MNFYPAKFDHGGVSGNRTSLLLCSNDRVESFNKRLKRNKDQN
jgi:hypothetical protein